MLWRVIKDYPDYEISPEGVIRLTKEQIFTDKNGKQRFNSIGMIVKQYPNAKGYVTTSLWKDNRSQTKYLHRLVYETFVSSIKDCITHVDGNKENNRPRNLEDKPLWLIKSLYWRKYHREKKALQA